MLRAYISPCVGLSSGVLLPSPLKHKNTTLLSDDSSKAWGLELLHLQKNFLPTPGKKTLLPQVSCRPLCKTHLLCGFQTRTPAVNPDFLLAGLSPHEAALQLAGGQDRLFIFGQC